MRRFLAGTRRAFWGCDMPGCPAHGAAMKKKTAFLLDPARPLVDEVVAWLLHCEDGKFSRLRITPSGVHSLAHLLVVVPTAQSGRRLRFALARRAAELGWGGLLPPKVSMTGPLLDGCGEGVATAAVELAVMADVLLALDLSSFPSLFPRPPAERSLRWALETAENILSISHVLGEGALSAHDVVSSSEPERWSEIARLEAEFEDALRRKSLRSRLAARRSAVAAGCQIGGVELIVLPSLADASLALQKYLENSEQETAVLVQASADEAHLLDEWGRPVGAFAAQVRPCDIFPAATPVAEAEDIASFFRLIASDERLPALAVCDAAMFPDLEGAFQSKFPADELVLRNPSQAIVAHTPLGRLLSGILSLSETDDYSVFSALLRSGDIARWLARVLDATPADVARFTAALDGVQNGHLPRTLAATICAIRDDIAASANENSRLELEGLLAACTAISRAVADPFAFLCGVFEGVMLDEHRPGDRELAAAARHVRELHAQVSCDAVAPRWRRRLFLKLLKRTAYMLEPSEQNILAANGWLEVPWCDEDELVIAGFNEGSVPESIVGHPFVPDALRASLGLQTNEMRARRDAFVFSRAVRCRAQGAVRVHLHQIAADKSVLKPSRLLFDGISDAALPSLAVRLYSVAQGDGGAPAKALPPAWRLRLPFPPKECSPRTSLSVTRLDHYLRCPFTFFLEETFGEASDDRAHELTPQTFGTLCHEVLDRFAKNGPADSVDPKVIADWLEREAQAVLACYGTDRPAIITLQGEALVARLRNFASAQAAWRRSGWRIVAAEQSLSCTLGQTQTRLRGKVDRIDENERTGQLAIIDYKTWDSPRDDIQSLQLPVYRAMVQCHPDYFGRADDAIALYCVLASRAEDTFFDVENAVGRAGQSDAEAQAMALLSRLAHGIFYPPVKDAFSKAGYGGLIWESPEQGIDIAWLEDQKARLAAWEDGGAS